MTTEKKLLNVTEIEAQVAMELPNREVMSYGYGSPLFVLSIAPITTNVAMAYNYCPGTAALYASAQPGCYATALAGVLVKK